MCGDLKHLELGCLYTILNGAVQTISFSCGMFLFSGVKLVVNRRRIEEVEEVKGAVRSVCCPKSLSRVFLHWSYEVDVIVWELVVGALLCWYYLSKEDVRSVDFGENIKKLSAWIIWLDQMPLVSLSNWWVLWRQSRSMVERPLFLIAWIRSASSSLYVMWWVRCPLIVLN